MHPHRPRVIVVDDDRDIQTTVGALALAEGFEVATTLNGADAAAQLRQRPAHLALIDAGRADVSGVDLLRTIRTLGPRCRVALMSHDTSQDRIVDAISSGAVDYLRKPLDTERLRTVLIGVREQDAQRRAVLAVEAEVAHRLEFCGMVGRGPAMQAVFDLIRRLAPHARSAILTGEPGTGKQLAAQALHALGPHRSGPFTVINCSAVVEAIFERELFGHGRDVVTGVSANAGLLEAADGGTVLLEHIDDLSLLLQARLLQVLDTRCVQRVGSLEWRRIDVHVLASTQRDLRRQVAAGRFNADLYDRLAHADVRLPPLRERPEDISYLTAAFVRNFAERFAKPLAGLTTEAEHFLRNATWHDNVRELRGVLERACILADGELITAADFSAVTSHAPFSRARRAPGLAVRRDNIGHGRPGSMSAVERDHIVRTLEQVHGNKALAARLLGVSRRAFYRQLERHGLHTRTRGTSTAAGRSPLAEPV